MADAVSGAIEVIAGVREAGFARLREAMARAGRLTFEFGPPWSAKPLDELHGDPLLATGERVAAAAAYRKVLASSPNRPPRDGGAGARRGRARRRRRGRSAPIALTGPPRVRRGRPRTQRNADRMQPAATPAVKPA